MLSWVIKRSSASLTLCSLFSVHLKAFCAKFLPIAVVATLCYLALMVTMCHDNARDLTSDTICSNLMCSTHSHSHITTFHCRIFASPASNATTQLSQELVESILLVSRCSTEILFCVYTVAASAVFVHYRQLWTPPCTNIAWTIIALVLLLLSIIHCTAFHSFETFTRLIDTNQLIVLGCTALLILPYVLHLLLYKRRELRLFQRNQRRRKLNFHTKLGMNSPY